MHVSPDIIPYWFPDVPEDSKSVVGLSFDIFEIAYEFYKQYARKSGFISRKSTNNRNKQGNVSWKYFVCSRTGITRPTYPYKSLTYKGKKPHITSS